MNYTVFQTPVIRTLFRWTALLLLKLTGWKTAGNVPGMKKFVMIAAPHTTNWDFFYTMLIAFAMKVDIYWMGKNTLFRGPAGIVLRWLGGIAIDRSKANNMVGQCVAAFNENEKLVITVPPEGTRSKTRYWKTGFYHIAHQANVPIVLGFLDFRLKRGGVGPVLVPTGDIEEDMKLVKAFYRNVTGKYPDKTSSAEVFTGTYLNIDYSPVVSSVDSVLQPSGDLDADALMLRAYYADMTGQIDSCAGASPSLMN